MPCRQRLEERAMRTVQHQTRLFRTTLGVGREHKTFFSAGRVPVLRKTNVQAYGFALIELMIVLAIVAILSAIALPAYDQYVKKGRAKAASSDLVALSLNLENTFQRTLTYPAAAPATTSGTEALAPGWYPSEKKHFKYSVNSNAASYVLAATGIEGMSGCDLTLASDNTRTISGSNCGGLTSW